MSARVFLVLAAARVRHAAHAYMLAFALAQR
jgi:hypothetical protein